MSYTPPPPATPLTTQQAIKLVWELGYIIALPAVIFGFGGAYLDTYVGTSPLFTLLGFVVAFCLSAVVVVRLVKRLLSR